MYDRNDGILSLWDVKSTISCQQVVGRQWYYVIFNRWWADVWLHSVHLNDLLILPNCICSLICNYSHNHTIRIVVPTYISHSTRMIVYRIISKWIRVPRHMREHFNIRVWRITTYRNNILSVLTFIEKRYPFDLPLNKPTLTAVMFIFTRSILIKFQPWQPRWQPTMIVLMLFAYSITIVSSFDCQVVINPSISNILYISEV